MNASQLHEFVVKEALEGHPVEEAGDFYQKLCLAFPLKGISGKENHARALKILAKLSEILRTEKMEAKGKKQILGYMDALGLLVESYEKKRFSANLDDVSGRDVLEFLMEEHSLKQSDLENELGAQSIVSEILAGKRRLNSQQILALSKRFGLSPSTFFP